MMRRTSALLACAAAFATIVAVASIVPSEPVRAGGPTFVIPVNDGYGIAECVDTGSSCGKVVADAWCEAQGFPRSVSIGPADVETTGSIDASRRRIAVTCAP